MIMIQKILKGTHIYFSIDDMYNGNDGNTKAHDNSSSSASSSEELSPLQAKILGIFSRVLKNNRVSLQDIFVEMGGGM
jgi:hypothetical protein